MIDAADEDQISAAVRKAVRAVLEEMQAKKMVAKVPASTSDALQMLGQAAALKALGEKKPK